MSELQHTMLKQARERYRTIFPCWPRGSFNECFTVEGDKLCFWFNTEDDSTHLEYVEML